MAIDMNALAGRLRETQGDVILPVKNENHVLGVQSPVGAPVAADIKKDLKVPEGVEVKNKLVIKDNSVDGIKHGLIVNEKNPVVVGGGEKVALRRSVDGMEQPIDVPEQITYTNPTINLAGVKIEDKESRKE